LCIIASISVLQLPREMEDLYRSEMQFESMVRVLTNLMALAAQSSLLLTLFMVLFPLLEYHSRRVFFPSFSALFPNFPFYESELGGKKGILKFQWKKMKQGLCSSRVLPF
jgi:hypothetical protein